MGSVSGVGCVDSYDRSSSQAFVGPDHAGHCDTETNKTSRCPEARSSSDCLQRKRTDIYGLLLFMASKKIRGRKR